MRASRSRRSSSTASPSPKADAISGRPIPPCAWTFPDLDALPAGEDLIAVGADLEPGTLIGAYSSGFFPMPLGRRKVGWFSPDPRGVLLPDRLRVSRSLRRSARRYDYTIDRAFDQVIRACGDPSRPLGWIDPAVIKAYTRLHHLGWAHSIEVWDDEGLAGGLYGVEIGGFFAGESMFHRRTDASKAALVHLVDVLGEREGSFIDVQWVTPHLETLGVEAIRRSDYGRMLAVATALPRAGAFMHVD